MITGSVMSIMEAVISLTVQGPGSQEEKVDAVIDTGFNGFLTLPSSVVSKLGLPFAGTTKATLGDGSVVKTDVYEASVFWDGEKKDIVALKGEGAILLGMSLLSGYRLIVDVEIGGSVTIEELP